MQVKQQRDPYLFFGNNNLLAIIILIILISISIRFPFNFKDFFSRDEITYVIMGKLVAEGQIPFVNFWEMKPSFAWYIYSILYKLSSGNIFYFRFLSSIILSISALVLFLISLKLSQNIRNSFFISILFTISQSFLLSDGKEVLTEHFCLIFFLIGIFFIINKKYFLLAGFFFVLSVLIRLNIALPICGIIIYQIIILKKKEINISNFLNLILPIFIIPLFLIIYYILINQLEVFYDTYINVPKIYSNLGYKDKSLFDISEVFLKSLLAPNDINIYNRLIFWLFSLIGFIIVLRKKKFSNYKFNIFNIAAILTFLSLIPGGRYFPHYFIQVMPFAAFFFISLFENKKDIKRFLILLILPFPLLFKYPIVEINNILKYKDDNLNYGCGNEIYKFLKDKIKQEEKIFANACHVIYLYLDKYPPTKFIHPNWIKKSREDVVKVISKNSVKEEYENILNSVNYLVLPHKIDELPVRYDVDNEIVHAFKIIKKFSFEEQFYRPYRNLYIYTKN